MDMKRLLRKGTTEAKKEKGEEGKVCGLSKQKEPKHAHMGEAKREDRGCIRIVRLLTCWR